jgi:hypothetical protein
VALAPKRKVRGIGSVCERNEGMLMHLFIADGLPAERAAPIVTIEVGVLSHDSTVTSSGQLHTPLSRHSPLLRASSQVLASLCRKELPRVAERTQLLRPIHSAPWRHLEAQPDEKFGPACRADLGFAADAVTVRIEVMRIATHNGEVVVRGNIRTVEIRGWGWDIEIGVRRATVTAAATAATARRVDHAELQQRMQLDVVRCRSRLPVVRCAHSRICSLR